MTNVSKILTEGNGALITDRYFSHPLHSSRPESFVEEWKRTVSSPNYGYLSPEILFQRDKKVKLEKLVSDQT